MGRDKLVTFYSNYTLIRSSRALINDYLKYADFWMMHEVIIQNILHNVYNLVVLLGVMLCKWDYVEGLLSVICHNTCHKPTCDKQLWRF